MTEQEQEQVWRVVVHERDANGWWTVCPMRYPSEEDARQAAARKLSPCYRGPCYSNAGVYPERDGRVDMPGWIKVRREGEAP